MDDYLKQAASDILTILADPPKSTLKTLEAGDITRNALQKIATLLHRADPLPPQLQPLPPATQTPRVPTPPALPLPRVLEPPPINENPPPLIENINSDDDSSVEEMTPMTRKKLPTKVPLPRVVKLNKPMPRLLKQKTLSRYPLQRTSHERFRSKAVDYLVAQHLFQPTNYFSASHIYNASGKKQTLDALLNGEFGDVRWRPALSNEWGRLAQGNTNGESDESTEISITIPSVVMNQMSEA